MLLNVNYYKSTSGNWHNSQFNIDCTVEKNAQISWFMSTFAWQLKHWQIVVNKVCMNCACGTEQDTQKEGDTPKCKE